MKLGQPVRFTHTLYRHYVMGDYQTVVTWEPKECPVTEGVLVGLRCVQNGAICYESELDDYTLISHKTKVWRRSGTVLAAVVATNLYRLPILIPREEVCELTTPTV